MLSRTGALLSRLRLFLVFLLVLAGCEEQTGPSLGERMDRAKEARIEGDLRAAILELKNALTEHPDSAAARYLLGQIYLEMENGAAAEKELMQAQRLGLDDEALVVPLSRARIMQGEYRKVLDDVRISINLPATTQAALWVVRGDAHFGLGEGDQARDAYEKALKANPRETLAYVGLGNVALRTSNIEEASAMYEKAAEIDPGDLRVIILKGDIASAQGRFDDALKAYTELVSKRPENVLYRTVLAWAQVNVRDYESANRNIDRVLALVPDYPPANHVKAVAAFQTKQYALARDHANRVLAAYPDRTQTLLVHGAASYALGNLEQAYNSLRRYVVAVPDDPAGRKLLSQVQIALGRSDEALETLDPLVNAQGEETNDAEIFELVASASLLKGDLSTGRSFLERSLQVRPDSVEAMTALGKTQIALGDVDKGLERIEEAVARSPKDFSRHMMLAMEYLRTRKADKALEAGRKLQSLRPNRATGYTIEGLAHAMAGDEMAARKALRKALEVEPGNPNAAFNLVRYAARDEEWDEVGKLLDKVLAVHPDNLKALLMYAELMKKEDKPAKVRAYLERAVASNPESREANILLAQDYMATGEYLKGLEVARAILPVYPRDPALLELVGRLEMAAGQVESAVVTFGSLTEVRPGSPVSHYLLATALERQGNLVAAEQSLDRVLEIDQAHIGGRFAKARVAAALGRLDEAETLLAKLAEDHPEEPEFLETRGVIAALRGNASIAIASLEKAFEARPNSINLRRLAETQAQAGAFAEARARLASWLETYPDDQATRLLLANLLLGAGDLEAAEAQYRRIIKDQPDSAVALNNLAYLLNQDGRTDQAVLYIERALAIRPNDVEILDTAGAIYLRAGRALASVGAYRKAVDLAPRNMDLRQRYAEALLAVGRTEEAAKVIEAMLNSPYPLANRDAVEALYQKVTSQ